MVYIFFSKLNCPCNLSLLFFFWGNVDFSWILIWTFIFQNVQNRQRCSIYIHLPWVLPQDTDDMLQAHFATINAVYEIFFEFRVSLRRHQHEQSVFTHKIMLSPLILSYPLSPYNRSLQQFLSCCAKQKKYPKIISTWIMKKLSPNFINQRCYSPTLTSWSYVIMW